MTAGLSNEATALLERAKQQGGPTAAQTAKIGAAVFAATTASAATAATVTTAASATAAGTVASSTSLLTIVGAGLVATALGIGGTVAVKRALAPTEPPRPRVITAAPPRPVMREPVVAPPVVAQPTEPASAEPAAPQPTPPVVASPRPLRVEPVPVVASSPVETPAPTPDVPAPTTPGPRRDAPVIDTTAAQVAALTSAVEALEHHEPEIARATARAARLSAPTGVLSPELMVVEITALCELGRRDDAVTLSRAMTSAEQTPLVRGKLGRTCVGTGE